jgi:MoaA/NifB/PqqE/SkfB family radical SAM enzyme
MKRNIADLPNVVRLGRQLGASRFLVTNVLPYTREMSDQALYLSTLIHTGFRSSYYQIALPRFDRSRSTGEAVHEIDDLYRIAWPGSDPGESSNRCSFVLRGATVIRWDGNVSPCLPLMYDHQGFVDGVERFSRNY